jgi:hypothetical protein
MLAIGNRKMKRIIFVILTAIVSSVVHGGIVTGSLSGYIDIDDSLDKMSYRYDPDEGASAAIEIVLGQKTTKRILKNFAMSDSHLVVRSKQKGEIEIFEAGDLGSSDKVTHYYKYNEKKGDWYLVKDLFETRDWETFRPLYSFQYYPGVKGIGGEDIDSGDANPEPEKIRVERLRVSLEALNGQLSTMFKSKQLASMKADQCNERDVAELLFNIPVDEHTVEVYNNIGFFFAQSDSGRPCGLYILRAVVENQPERTPAFLNIADLYDAMGLPEKAKSAYRKYIALMKKEGKSGRIPQRVIKKAE